MIKMLLTTTMHITQNNKDNVDLSTLSKLAYHSARLYNVGLYAARQHYISNGKYLSYNEIYKASCANENYTILLSDMAQQTLRLVERDMTSFKKAVYAKKFGKLSFRVNLPSYKDKEGIMSFIIYGRSCRVQKNNTIAIGLTKEFREKYDIKERRFFLTIPKNIRHIKEFNELRFHPLYGGKEYSVEFVYEQPCSVSETNNEPRNVLSIDLGVDNLMACTVYSDNGFQNQFLIDGRPIKSINCYYNKMVAKLKSVYSTDKRIDNPYTTKRMRRLINGRRFRINDYFNQSVDLIIRVCKKYHVSTVVIGYNEGFKQNVNMGKKNNQTFVSIPYYKLRSKLEYKCEMNGLTYVEQEESYTSKASSLDLDDLPSYKYNDKNVYAFSGKRIKRGLYRFSDGCILNADINGAINILRKYFKECKWNDILSDHVRALVNAPCCRITPASQAPSFMVG